MPELKRKADKEIWARFEEFSASINKLKSRLDASRTALGTGEEKGPPEYFRIIEICIALAGAQITQNNNQMKQSEVCIEYVDGFDEKYEKILAMLAEIERRLSALEAPGKQKDAVERFFDQKFAKMAKWLGYIGLFFTAAAYWADLAAIID